MQGYTRPEPITRRESRYHLDLSIPDIHRHSRREPSRHDGVDDGELRSVGYGDALRYVGGCAGTVRGEVESVAVLDGRFAQDVRGERGDEVEGVVGDEGVVGGAGAVVELAVAVPVYPDLAGPDVGVEPVGEVFGENRAAGTSAPHLK